MCGSYLGGKPIVWRDRFTQSAGLVPQRARGPSYRSLLSGLSEPNGGAAASSQALLGVKMEPRGSLGKREKLACQLTTLTGRASPPGRAEAGRWSWRRTTGGEEGGLPRAQMAKSPRNTLAMRTSAWTWSPSTTPISSNSARGTSTATVSPEGSLSSTFT